MNREGMSIGDGKGIYMSECRNWYNGDPILEEYHDHEWCKISHDDDFQFQMLCLEGASVGLSWQIIMHKRAAYETAKAVLTSVLSVFDIQEIRWMNQKL